MLFLIRELDYGGTEQQLTETVRGLDRNLFEPHVGCFIAKGLQSEKLRAIGVPIVEFPIRSFRSPGTILSNALNLRRYTRAHKIEIVHTFDVPANLFGVFAARGARVPVVISSQRALRELTGRGTHWLLRATDRLVDSIVVNSDAVRRQLIRQDNVPENRCRLIYNGLDTHRFSPEGRERPDCLQDASLVIGAVCSFRREKGLPTLVEAFATVYRENPGLRLLLVGDGPIEEQLRSQVRSLGLEDVTVFRPVTHDVPLWLRGIDIFVLPSLSEALSNSIMEAMACGCAVVASDVGGNPELVLDGKTGLLFPVRDSAALAERLRRLIANTELRSRLALAASHRMHTEFSRAIAVRKVQALYSELLAEKTSR